MVKGRWIGMVATVGLVWSATPCFAQDQGCDYEGRHYEEGATICQSGLQQNCVNGMWQSLDGERCGAGEDQEELPSGNLEVLPQGGFAEE